jgi:lactoylglutathione lyase
MRLDHVAFQVSDLDRAIGFYTETLGLTLLFRQRDEEHHEAFAFLELEGGNLELLQCLDEKNQPVPFVPSEAKPPFTPHVAIRAENLDQFAKSLREKEVPIVKGPLEIPGQVKWVYASDPDGNVVEFVEWL